MRIALLSLGTQGDVALMTTLGRRLAARGAGVTLGASPFYSGEAERAGLGFEPIGDGGFREMRDALAAAVAEPTPARRTERFFQAWIRPQLTAGEAGLRGLAAGADYYVSNLKMALADGGRVKPTARVTYDPPGSLADLDRFGPVRSEVIDLVALPRELFDPEGRCDPRYEFTGFWLPERADDPELPPDLERFVNDGAGDVVAVTLGSMPVGDPGALKRVVSEAAKAAGLRCVLVGAWSGVEPGLCDDGVTLVVESAPYDWLFARSACVVHHGGVGTAGMAIRAGVPAVVTPVLSCQHEMADLLRDAGIAAAKVTDVLAGSAPLAEAIAHAARSPELRQSASLWSARVDRDRGADLAAQRVFDHYEQLFG